MQNHHVESVDTIEDTIRYIWFKDVFTTPD